MIVQCEHCQTKYRIADDKVKGKGVKVRCAKCENVFTVTPPENGIQAPAAAPPAPEQPATSQPEPMTDVTDGTGSPAPGHLEGGTRKLPESPSLPPLDTPQETDLSREVPGPGDTLPDDQTWEEHLQKPPVGELGDSGDTGAHRPAHEMDDGGLASQSVDPAEPSNGGDFQIEATLRDEPSTGSDPFGINESAGLPPLTQDADQDGEWGNIPIDDQEAPGAGENDLGLAGESGYVPPPPVPMEETMEQELHDHMSEPLPGASTVPAYEPETRSSGGGKKMLVFLVLLAALGGGGYLAYPTVMEMIQARTQQPEGTLTPANIQVKVLNRTDGKIIYSVRGEVRNESEGNVGLIQVEAQFRNANGDVLAQTTSYCGNVFEEKDLINSDLNILQSELQNELGQSLSNSSLSPGQALPFLVILDNPPSGIQKVTVTISSFKETT